jgi:Family of unknown function (DUF5670)
MTLHVAGNYCTCARKLCNPLRHPSHKAVLTDNIQLDHIRGSKCTIIGMLWTIAVILLIFWLLGFSFHVGGALIHLILVIVVIVVVIRLVTGRGV